MRIVEKLKLRRKSRPSLTNGLRQSVEAFERRELMAANFLQGVVAVGGAPLAGASVSVYSLPSDQQVGGSQVTGTDGAYLFSGLAAGQYRIVESPPTGYANSTTQATTQLDQVNASTASSIDVTLTDPTSAWTLNTAGSNMELINFTASNPVVVDGINTSTETGSVTANVVEPGYTTPNFSIFCVDLNRDIYPDPYSSGNQNTNLPYTIEPLAQELATIAGTSAANSGRIAYLYNTYGQASLTASQAAGLQLAIWELEYDANPSDVTSGEFQVAGGTDPNAIATANACLADSVGKNQVAVFLDGLPYSGQASGSQGMIASGTFNFNNIAAPPATSSICGTVYNDCTGNGLTATTNAPKAGDSPEAGVTVNLINSSGVLVASTVTGANGTYSFKNLPYGTYYVGEVTPTGQIETAPNSGYYTATTSVSTPSVTNENFANFKPCNLSGVSGIYYSVTTNGWTNWVSDLRGHTSQGSVVTAYFYVGWGSTDTLTLASYIAPASSYSQATAPQQNLFCYQTQTFGFGWHSLTVTLPKSYYQVDFACGSVITQFGGTGSNVNYNTEDRLISADNGGNNAFTTASYAGCGWNWTPCSIVIPSTNKNSWCCFLWF